MQCSVSKVAHGRNLGKGMRTEEADNDASLVHCDVSLMFPKIEAVL